MQFFGKIGALAFATSFAVFGWAVALRLIWGTSLIQTPLPLLAATAGLAGILFLLLGIMAEIITRTYFESRGKAPYKVRAVFSQATPGEPARAPRRW
jgi:dolichol-phosphate mannosyltransferase